MDIQLAILIVLTFIIHLIGTLAYSVRIAGIRTRRIAVSFALFNILVLVSRTSNSFQGPFLAKRIEQSLNIPQPHILTDLRWLLLSATLATIVGAFLIPTFQRLFCKAVLHFQLAQTYAQLQQIPQAIQELEEGLKYAPDDPIAPRMLQRLRGM